MVSTNLLCLSRAGVTCVAFKPDNPNIVVSGSDDKTIKTWDITSGSCLSTLTAHSYYVNAVAWSPCGQWLASGGDDEMIFIYNANTFEVKSSLTGHQNRVISVHFSPDGKRLVSGSWDETVMVWDPSTGEQLCQLNAHGA